MAWLQLVGAAVVSGLALSVVLVAIMALSSRAARDMWVDNYPPDVREKFGPMSPRALRLRPYVATAFFIAMVAVPLIGLALYRPATWEPTFVPSFVFGFLTLLTFNAFDLLVLDFLVFSTWQPRWIVLPGTEGMAGYRDYRFHLVGFSRGLVFCVLGGLVVALIAVVGA